jgi:hypothetical protein
MLSKGGVDKSTETRHGSSSRSESIIKSGDPNYRIWGWRMVIEEKSGGVEKTK